MLSVKVEQLVSDPIASLGLSLLAGRAGLGRRITVPRIQKPGLALTGYTEQVHPERVQVLGAAEHSYLKSLAPKVRVGRFRALCARKIPCLVVSRGFHLDPAVLAVAAEEKIAVFRTPMITMKFINAATITLDFMSTPSLAIQSAVDQTIALHARAREGL